MSDPVLSMILAEAGCPYSDGSTESVAWAQGYKAGLAKALPPRMSDPVQTERPPRRRRA
jgi:hypothetical protein